MKKVTYSNKDSDGDDMMEIEGDDASRLRLWTYGGYSGMSIATENGEAVDLSKDHAQEIIHYLLTWIEEKT